MPIEMRTSIVKMKQASLTVNDLSIKTKKKSKNAPITINEIENFRLEKPAKTLQFDQSGILATIGQYAITAAIISAIE